MQVEPRSKMELLDVLDVANLLRFPVSRVRYEMQMGRLSYLKIGRSVRFERDAVEQWIKSHGVRRGSR